MRRKPHRPRLGPASLLLSLLTVAVAALALTLTTAVSGAPTRASGTLQLKASFAVKWTAAFSCPPGLPATNSCYAYVGDAVVPGLGHVTERYTKTFDGNRDAPCVRPLPNPVVEVVGKGELEVTRLGPECMGIPPARFSFDTTITGGSGTYAGASGSVSVDSHVTGIPGIEGTAVDVWTGTLTVPGLEFDVTPLDGGRSLIRQTATFDPRGVMGYAYWYAVYPIHAVIFRGLLRRIAQQAERGQVLPSLAPS